jgi:hypothetical protein
MTAKEVHIVICAAGRARDVGTLVQGALDRHWSVRLIATPAALEEGLVDVEGLEKQTRRQVIRSYSKPGESRIPKADAIIVAPATANTIAKLALAIADTHTSALLNQAVGAKIPVVILPSIKDDHMQRIAFKNHVATLRREGVIVLLGGKDGIIPTNQSSKDGPLPPFPWELALRATEASL